MEKLWMIFLNKVTSPLLGLTAIVWIANIRDVLSVISLIIAIGYGIWRWRREAKSKKNNNDLFE